MPSTDDYGRVVETLRWATAPPPGPIIPPMPAALTAARSPRWPAFLKEFLRAHPDCAGCGRHAQTGHHVLPFHVDPARELDPANVTPVCVPCHFVVCHLGDWHTYDALCPAALASHLKRVRAAAEI